MEEAIEYLPAIGIDNDGQTIKLADGVDARGGVLFGRMPNLQVPTAALGTRCPELKVDRPFR